MWVSTRAQYGMRALVEIALGGDEPTSLKVVAERQNISQHYLEQIVAPLRRADIVESVRGAYGGYRLARPPAPGERARGGRTHGRQRRPGRLYRLRRRLRPDRQLLDRSALATGGRGGQERAP